ncbi:hypothetical protein VNO77_20500 [Canavalia gladiata]|uniref:Leucine-rich repeat-containing N-terminal plant-type domain-containing protein n=1 Tax=Canavalia gladiata TaxID=3824 RepID=A0AAN9QLB4_CANGL
MRMKITVGAFLVLLGLLFCEGCWKNEREALLALNAQFATPLPWEDATDCCKWERVQCSTTTGRVTILDLSSAAWHNSDEKWYLNYSDFRAFQHLKSLNLAANNIAGFVANQGSHSFINLEVLDMSNNNFNESDISSALSGLSSLKTLKLEDSQLTSRSIRGISKLRTLENLYLAENGLNDSILKSPEKEEFAWPINLQYLGLGENGFSNVLLSSLSGLPRLKSLYLGNNKFEGSLNISGILGLSNLEILDLSHNNITGFEGHQDWSGLKVLEELDISYNEFEGPLPPSFANLTSLQNLDLSHNHFTGNIGSSLASLTSLEYLSFEGNQFEVPISFTPFANHSNLKSIYGKGNKVILDSQSTLVTWVPKFQLEVLSLSSMTETNSLPLPNFLFYQYNLSLLELPDCRFKGEFPNWLLENNTKLIYFVLTNSTFTGTFQLPSRPLLNLYEIDLSDNSITGQIPNNNISSIFPNLIYLNMSMNAIHGSIPHEFGQMNSLETLDLSNNYLSGELPKNMSRLNFLSLSNNKLNGTLFPSLSTMNQLWFLFLDGNSLSGNIPIAFYNTSLLALDVSNNLLVGKLPRGEGNRSSLKMLLMSNNNLEGSIPTEFVELISLRYLDLSHNKLTNSVPSFVNSSAKFIHLSNNRLSGLTKGMFGNRSTLVTLDLRYNEITSTIHQLVQDLRYRGLKILLLKGNHFTGHIPKELCHLTDLILLDLSHNNFNGPIPNCLGTIQFGNEDPIDLQGTFDSAYALGSRYSFNLQQYVQEKVEFTTKERSYTYTGKVVSYMNGIDLSSNRLNGSIPFELGNLTKIRGLNLSHNYLTGQIPITFSNLAQIESLDVSFNKLNGNIPLQLSELTFLAVFSVAHNNLSGATPDRKGQFMTFDERSYQDNPFLCGLPLPKACVGQPPVNLPNDSYIEGTDSLVDMYVFYVSFAVSYTSILLVIAATLFINQHWRRAWFYYIELLSTSCYYFIQDNLCKFSIMKIK